MTIFDVKKFPVLLRGRKLTHKDLRFLAILAIIPARHNFKRYLVHCSLMIEI